MEDEKDSPPLQRTGPEGGRLSKEKLTWPWWWSETFTVIILTIIIMITITILLLILVIMIIITTITMVRIKLKSNLLRRLTVGQTAKWILFLTQSLKNSHYHWEKYKCLLCLYLYKLGSSSTLKPWTIRSAPSFSRACAETLLNFHWQWKPCVKETDPNCPMIGCPNYVQNCELQKYSGWLKNLEHHLCGSELSSLKAKVQLWIFLWRWSWWWQWCWWCPITMVRSDKER